MGRGTQTRMGIDLMEAMTARTRVRFAALAAALGCLLVAAPSASAFDTGARATDEVQKWASNKSFTSPYAYVEVVHEGRRLDRTAITRCKGIYADKAVTVQISTCGPKWRVRAAYVSMNRRHEHIRILYAPRDRPPA